MKNIKLLFSLLMIVVVAGCSDDDRSTDFLQNTEAPSNIDLTFLITNDNSGVVQVTPTGQGATSFEVFANNDADSSVILIPGESTSFTYDEGSYDLRVLAKGIDGDITEYIETLTVSFEAPQNLDVSISPVAGDVFSVSVEASADFEAYFEFFPGVAEDEEPIQFMEGETITFTYDMVGDYSASVVAYSGGAATTVYTETISILNPLLLPINFEDETLNFNFIDFNGTSTTVVDSPNDASEDQGLKVAQTIKGEGAEFYAGTVIELDEPIDFSTLSKIKIDVFSPKAGITVKMKLENLTNSEIATEVDVVNTVANEWETLVFDFGESDLTQEYQKLVIFFDFGEVGDGSTYSFDNIELTSFSGGDAPEMAAPTPTAGNVISLFSDAYTDVPVDTWNTSWSNSGFEDVFIEGNATKKYFDLGFNGIETVSTPVDASEMTHLHLDVWTPNVTAFRIKLVDFLGDGFQGSNGDTEAELTVTPGQGQWVGIDIALEDFITAGMTSFADLNQYVISADPYQESIIYIDNVYFYNNSTEPTTAAPTPSHAASEVISLFSEAYSNVTVDTWNTDWSNTSYEEVMIDGNATKLYTSLGFNGIETVASPVDASEMTHLHMDIWTPNITAFRLKLVDFNGDGYQGANGDTEAELTFTPTQGGWVSLDIPLADFAAAGMTNFSDINQYIISSDPYESGIVYIDNVYFYK